MPAETLQETLTSVGPRFSLQLELVPATQRYKSCWSEYKSCWFELTGVGVYFAHDINEVAHGIIPLQRNKISNH